LRHGLWLSVDLFSFSFEEEVPKAKTATSASLRGEFSILAVCMQLELESGESRKHKMIKEDFYKKRREKCVAPSSILTLTQCSYHVETSNSSKNATCQILNNHPGKRVAPIVVSQLSVLVKGFNDEEISVDP
jgi:hypothetical protein